MANLFDFQNAYGFGMESEDLIEETVDVNDPVVEEATDEVVDGGKNTQELQEDTPQIVNTDDVTNVVDDLGDTFVYGNDERPVSSDVDYIPEDLKAEIEAIEKMSDQDAQVGETMGLPEEDTYHEIPGGVDLTNDTDETVQGFDKVEEYAKVDEVKVTGNTGDVDAYMRGEYGDSDDTASITGTADNQVELNPSEVSINDTGNQPNDGLSALQSGDDEGIDNVEVSADEVDGEDTENDALQAKDVLGTESDDFEVEEEVEVEDDGEETEVESDDEDSDMDDIDEGEDTESEEAEEVDVDSDGDIDSDDVEVVTETEVTVSEGDDEVPADTCCAEEHAIVDSLDVDLNFDTGTTLTPEEQEEAQNAVSETEVEIANTALDGVSELTDVNSPNGETGEPQTTEEEGDRVETATIGDDTMLSDVIGDRVAETSHGDEDKEGFFEGDIPVNDDVTAENPEEQVSEGDASYDEGEGDDYADGDVEVEEDVEIEDGGEEDDIEVTEDVEDDGEVIEETTEEVTEDIEENDDDNFEDIEEDDEF